MYSNIKQQSSTMQNCNHFCTNLIAYVCVCVCVCVYMRHLSVLFAKPGSKWLITIFKFDLFTEL